MQVRFARGHKVTWAELVIREHRLAHVKRRVEMARDDGIAPSYCANDHWFGCGGRVPGIQAQLSRLLGPESRPDDPVLGTQAALDVANTTLRAQLSPCRGCGCLARRETGW
jgi:hypothetical protein